MEEERFCEGRAASSFVLYLLEEDSLAVLVPEVPMHSAENQFCWGRNWQLTFAMSARETRKPSKP